MFTMYTIRVHNQQIYVFFNNINHMLMKKVANHQSLLLGEGHKHHSLF